MAILRDEYGNDLEDGDEISVGEYIQALDTWTYSYGIYREKEDYAYMEMAEGEARILFLYDYIRITKPVRERKLYGYRDKT